MTTIVFDLETTAIPASGIQDIERIHCLAAECVETGKKYFASSTESIASMMPILTTAETLSGHNIIGFDIPVLQKFFPEFKPLGKIVDTLVMARALWHDVINKDFGRTKVGKLPARLRGSHSLEAYGYRLGILKGEYCHLENAWDNYTEEMGEYCRQDVTVTKALYNKVVALASNEMLELENDFAQIIYKQELKGVYFNEKNAVSLMQILREKKDSLYRELQVSFGPKVIPVDQGKTFKAQRRLNSMPGCEKGNQYCKIKIEEFNPASRQQIADRLMSLGWEPEQFTEKGAVIVNEAVLKTLDYPEAKLLVEFLTVNKRLGQIADGNQGWLKKVKKGRIHGRVNTGGAISGRCTHSNPNLAQVPAVNAPWGQECRALFGVPEGYRMVGCDASGLELRCLAHYLARFDGGAYADIVLNGDIHTANQEAAGLPERNMAKTFIYGWLYGAGPAKIGKIVGGGIKEGAQLQARFMKRFPAVKKLKDAVEKAVKERGYLIGLDGRRLRTRSEHSALNLLLQSAGALIMKRFTIEAYRMSEHLNRHFVLSIHDEIQVEIQKDQAKEFGEICLKAMIKAGEYFKFRIPIEGEYKIGKNWAQTH